MNGTLLLRDTLKSVTQIFMPIQELLVDCEYISSHIKHITSLLEAECGECMSYHEYVAYPTLSKIWTSAHCILEWNCCMREFDKTVMYTDRKE